MAILCFNSIRALWSASPTFPQPNQRNEEHLDQELTLAASTALGKRAGTVIVMDPRSGRVRTVVNPEVAFAAAFPPGSTVKPFSALAALRSGTIKHDSRISCREHYSHEGFTTVCSHPRDLPPLKPAEAIAYSCNYYFGKLGEQLSEASFDTTLAEFGFGRQTGVNWVGAQPELAGRLPYREWHAQNALGESDQIQVTPIQLLTAYAALVNGGHLFIPRIAQEKDFLPQLRAELRIDDQDRDLLIEGMRGSVRYGTAGRAGLDSLPLYVFGKTGTSTERKGFRTHGWFVGVGSRSTDISPEASEPELVVLIFLKRGHGVEAAELARPIFEAFARGAGGEDGETRRQGDTETRRPGDASVVTVHLVRENVTRTMSLEDYVLGVVAAEGSTETEIEGLKALAIASRTYALKNLHRHANEGYDFCTTTHCQRYRLVDPAAAGSLVKPEVIEAVARTKGEVLHDAGGQIVDSYFSASCGGATANLRTLWGVSAPPYLEGGRDEFCLTMPHNAWTDVISAADLLRAVQSDPETNVGRRLTSIVVTRRDEGGRAELITIEGDRRRTVSGWDFKIIVGRALGWNLLKSSRFEIVCVGSNYVFRGSGFGHGLGLCQEGAHVMARRGASHKQILAKYFPGTHVESTDGTATAITSTTSVRMDLLWHRPNSTSQFNPKRSPTAFAAAIQSVVTRRTLSSEHFSLSYPETVEQRDAEQVLRVLESSRHDLVRRVSIMGVRFQLAPLEIVINKTTGDFVGRTGQPPWVAAATRGQRIELQPLELLKGRRILETTLRHELVHALIYAIGHGRTPRWLEEGLALHYAGEGHLVSQYQTNTEIAISELDQRLSQPASAAEMRLAYAAAYREVKRLIGDEGEASVWRRAIQPG